MNKKPFYIVMEERGFYSGYAKYENINDALDNMCYNEIYEAKKIEGEELKRILELRKKYKKNSQRKF